MNAVASFLSTAIAIGAGATAITDLWAVLRKRLFGIPALDYALVGRWIAWMGHGQFFHHPISASPPVKHERLFGWMIHYAIGIAFAMLLLVIGGLDWRRDPALGPALTVGIATVSAPFFIMQPALGFGVAASRTPRPAHARMHTLITHTIFGLGLYVSAQLLSGLGGF